MRAVILDFYGTVVEEAYGLLDVISETFMRHGARQTREEVAAMWWPDFREKWGRAHGGKFRLQGEVVAGVLRHMIG